MWLEIQIYLDLYKAVINLFTENQFRMFVKVKYLKLWIWNKKKRWTLVEHIHGLIILQVLKFSKARHATYLGKVHKVS